ncbi:hypothetical protein [Demequina sp.]|uniref:hypothetical protein n=1 Tax=Demequina sp. TaxID=2050685 RepID=UPI003D0FE6AE
MSFIGLTPASADEVDPLTVVADVVPSVLAEAAPIEVDQSQGVGQVDVTVASDAAEGIRLSGAGAENLSIGLPFADDAQFVANSGEPFFDNGNGSSTVPLVKDDGSVQILTTIDNADAPSTCAYDLDLAAGASLSLTATGGAVVTEEDGRITLAIAEPRALDANGDAVPTHYTVNGTTLTQVIEFTDTTAFPVVADPSFSLGWAVYVKYSKAEVKRLAPSSVGATTAKAISAAVCGIIGAALTSTASPFIGVPVGMVCGALSSAYVTSVANTFNSAKANGKCVEMQFAYISGVPVSWKPYSC